MRHFKRKRMGTDVVKHSQTIIANVGFASVPTKLQIIKTAIGGRSAAGAIQTVKSSATTGNTCNVGDQIAYVNICIECSPRTTITDNDDSVGWLEYAIVYQMEREQDMVTTSLGTQTLMDTANKQYREQCLFTGCFPQGRNQAMSVDLKLKIPKKYLKLTVGNNLNCYMFFRSNNSAAVGTSTNRLVASCIYKSHS